ncbi:hypothetical protein [Actinophytocola algeriensis]|uniref:Uncharacterized protein n=1 Tax=Actinophytocola algeriensis TaxID=1768010 RepID=A0A7W7QB90_9PSEU|nr:hypothetical protein [Actinophytocola algeriensis]MBB4910084.1 hypothetical protein [Actinophytocola algeriensis]MBE1476074.1 hypothetical protein [Actinophytocola algeriensis]
MNDARSIALRHSRLGETALHPKIADARLAALHLRLAASMFTGIGDVIGHARTVPHLARALTLNGHAAEALSELAAIEQAVHDYGSVGYLADLCTALAVDELKASTPGWPHRERATQAGVRKEAVRLKEKNAQHRP